MTTTSEPADPGRTLRGSCLCGAVAYECRGPLRSVARCFCVECRKQSGSECAVNAEVAPGTLRISRGTGHLREFESSPGQFRVFCGRCGSPLFKRYAADPDRIRIRLGLLDVDFEEMPVLQVFTSERMRLTTVDSSIPSWERGVEPSRSANVP